MLTSSLKPIVEKTAKALNIPLAQANSVVFSVFKSMANNKHEFRAVGIRLEDFGLFYMNTFKIRNAIRSMVIALRRRSRVDFYTPKLKKALVLRHKIYAYDKSRKYKERFGHWHWK